MIAGGASVFAGDRAEEILRFAHDWMLDPARRADHAGSTSRPLRPRRFSPKRCTASRSSRWSPSTPGGARAVGRKLVQPLKDLGDPVADLRDVLPYTAMEPARRPLGPGAHNYDVLRLAVEELKEGAILMAILAPADATVWCRRRARDPPAPLRRRFARGSTDAGRSVTARRRSWRNVISSPLH